MASLSMKASKYKNIYCDPPRPEATFTNLRLSTTTGEQNYIKANSHFFAVGLQGGGGPLAVIKTNQPGRVKVEMPFISGHAGALTDFDFNPFNDYIVATGSEDSTVKVWGIPEEGLTANINTPLVDLPGHARKVCLLRFHPTAGTVLATAGADNAVKLWDVEKGLEINSLNDGHDQLIQELVWDYNGNNLATSSKDKNVRLIDARSAKVTDTIENAHEGAKSIKLTYLGPSNRLLSVGFTRTAMRQVKIWDPRNTKEDLYKFELDSAAGVIMPFFDPDTNVLYLAGKGDGNVRVYELNHEADGLSAITDFRTNVSAKGMAFVPKRGLDIIKNETARLLKLTTNTVEPLSFFVPRKAEGFQEDIFPDTFSGEPAHTADEWLAGSDKPPMTMPLNPALGSSKAATPTPGGSNKTFSFKSVPALTQELEKANARIKELEDRLRAAGLSTD